MPRDVVLTVNVGSSSLKVAVFGEGDDGTASAFVHIERIGTTGAARHVLQRGRTSTRSTVDAVDHPEALRRALEVLREWIPRVRCVSHRIVHGGPRHFEPMRLTERVVHDLEELTSWAPHVQPALSMVKILGSELPPGMTHVACFDTGFHRSLPRVARLYPLPESTLGANVRRFGFHGLSCESVLAALESLDPELATGRLLVAHLGSGASITAVNGGQSVDTTMGWSPLGGIMMSTRPGDLDPGLLLHLMERDGLTPAAVRDVLTQRSGLLGVSGTSSDVRDLLARAPDDQRAADALDLFCYTARKAIGALFAGLGGLDGLVFTGGIGEHAPTIRAGILSGLSALGIQMDPNANEEGRPVVSDVRSPVRVRIVRSNEERVLARHGRALS